MINQFLDYYKKAKMMQERKFEGFNWSKEQVDDDLVWHVPIYDVVNRRFAAFSSLLEAIKLKNLDPKGNGEYFKNDMTLNDFIIICYLFRLCGSGINYIPREDGEPPFGTHGFGNFWVIEELNKGFYKHKDWLLKIPDKGFCDVKGYMLPMIPGGIRNFILNESIELIMYLKEVIFLSDNKINIKKIVDKGNNWLLSKGYKRQNFVLTAFAMDMAEYLPNLVDQDSDVYVGSNARKCLKLILPKMKTDDALRYLCDLTEGKSKPYDMEDVACDFIRYIDNFQTKEHINFNNGIKYYNNVCK